MKRLIAINLIERDMVLGDGMIEALFGEHEVDHDPQRAWRVHFGYRACAWRSMRRLMARRGSLAPPARWQTYWRKGKLAELGDKMLLELYRLRQD